MIKELHVAAQYLAAAGISFLDKKDDDSHSNLGWSIQEQELSTWGLNDKNDQLSLNYSDFSLRWISSNTATVIFALEGKSHAEVLEWIKQQSKKGGITKPYKYDFHYELPYPFPEDEFIFNKIDLSEIAKHALLLDTAEEAFQNVLADPNFKSDIRIWPHHFDLGAYLQLGKLDIGFGLAIPDAAVEDFYYYVSGYKGEDSIETKSFDALTLGEWKTEDWKAAVLKTKGISSDQVITFLNEAIVSFQNH